MEEKEPKAKPEEATQTPENGELSIPRPPKGTMWITIAFNGNELSYQTNLKEKVNFLGMLEMVKLMEMDKQFRAAEDRPQLVVPRKLVLPS